MCHGHENTAPIAGAVFSRQGNLKAFLSNILAKGIAFLGLQDKTQLFDYLVVSQQLIEKV
jgi:ribosomal silencing factor RsfS